jgi:predicted Zn-dependent peptidase
MIVSAAGKLDHDQLVAEIERQFSGIGSGTSEKPAATDYQGGDKREARPLEQAHFLLGFNGVGYHDPGYYPLAVTSMILGGGMSSRLFQKIREELGLVYSIYSYASSYEDGGLFSVYAGTGEDGLAALVPALCDELTRAMGDISDSELSRAKTQLRAGMVMSLESTASRAEQIARQTAIYGQPLAIADLIERVEAVDMASVEAVLARVLKGRPTVAAVGPIGNLEAFDSIVTRFERAA